jgi:cellulose synthase/poly-beta-1,6-N-acetylglucosamine synthase-like glycosyltransferase
MRINRISDNSLRWRRLSAGAKAQRSQHGAESADCCGCQRIARDCHVLSPRTAVTRRERPCPAILAKTPRRFNDEPKKNSTKQGAHVVPGGYANNTVGEDMEIVVRLHRRFREMDKPYRIAFVPEPVCWTEVPETLEMLSRQRSRWHRGALETFATHHDMLFDPKYGRAGMLGMGRVFFFDVIAPVVELAGYILMPVMWLLGLLSFDFFAAYLAAAFAFGVAISVGSLAIEEAEMRRFPRARDLIILAAAAVFENFGYRQLNSHWRIKGMWQWLRGEHSWGTMTRKGFNTKGQAAA